MCLVLAGFSRPASIASAVHLDLAVHSTGSLSGPASSCPAVTVSAAHLDLVVGIFKQSSVVTSRNHLCLDLAVICLSERGLVAPPRPFIVM